MPIARWGVHLGSYATWDACRCECVKVVVLSIPILCWQGRYVWPGNGGRMGGGSGGKVMRWCATHRPVAGFTVDPLASTGHCRPHLVGGGVTAGLGAGRVTRVIVAEWSDPQTTTPTHHTHLKAPGHRAVPPRWRCRRAAPGAWWPPQCPCACRRRGQGMGQGGAPSPWRAREVCHTYTSEIFRDT